MKLRRRRPAAARRHKDPTAQIAGALGRRSGKAFEQAIDLVNAWYDRKGVAAVEKVNPPVTGWGSTLRVGASTVDYSGTLHPRGYLEGVAFDAKCVTGDATFKAPDAKAGRGRDRPRFFEQVRYLRERAERHGYYSGFLLYCNELETVWWVGAEHLTALSLGDGVPIRSIARPKRNAPPVITHHLPSIAAPLHRAALEQLHSRRPLLDYLRLISPTE